MHRIDRSRMNFNNTIVVAKCRIYCFNSQCGEHDSRLNVRNKAMWGGQSLDNIANNSDEKEIHTMDDERRATSSEQRVSEKNIKQTRRWNEQGATSDERRKTNDQQQDTSYELRATSNEQRTESDEQRATNDEQPDTSSEIRAKSNEQRATSNERQAKSDGGGERRATKGE